MSNTQEQVGKPWAASGTKYLLLAHAHVTSSQHALQLRAFSAPPIPVYPNGGQPWSVKTSQTLRISPGSKRGIVLDKGLGVLVPQLD